MKKNGQQQAEGRSSTTRIERGLEEGASWWDGLLGSPVLWAVIAIVGCTWLVLPRVGSGPPDWQPGEVASFDLVIPVDTTLPDEAATRAAREEAAASVLPVYDFEPRLRLELEDELHILFGGCRERQETGEKEAANLEAITDLRATEAMLRILDSSSCSETLENALVAVVGQVFRDHIEQVKSHVPADRLLVFEVKQGWGPLCAFLGKEMPDTPFPNVNDTEQFQQLIHKIRRTFFMIHTAGVVGAVALAGLAWRAFS